MDTKHAPPTTWIIVTPFDTQHAPPPNPIIAPPLTTQHNAPPIQLITASAPTGDIATLLDLIQLQVSEGHDEEIRCYDDTFKILAEMQERLNLE